MFAGGPSQGLGCICFYILTDFHLFFLFVVCCALFILFFHLSQCLICLIDLFSFVFFK